VRSTSRGSRTAACGGLLLAAALYAPGLGGPGRRWAMGVAARLGTCTVPFAVPVPSVLFFLPLCTCKHALSPGLVLKIFPKIFCKS
jgi:hypothetical protein